MLVDLVSVLVGPRFVVLLFVAIFTLLFNVHFVDSLVYFFPFVLGVEEN